MPPRHEHNARALWSPTADETIELDRCRPPRPTLQLSLSSGRLILVQVMVVWNFETADRLLSELVDNEPVPSLDDIIEWARLELETPFITPEVAALAVTAVAATTTAAAAPILQNNPIVFFVCVNGYLFFGHYKSTVLKFFFRR